MYTQDFIKNKLKTDIRWLLKGVVAIYNLQTFEEQASGNTIKGNGVGFNSADAPFLTSIAEQILADKFLTEKQINAVRKAMIKYSGQLTALANGKLQYAIFE